MVTQQSPITRRVVTPARQLPSQCYMSQSHCPSIIDNCNDVPLFTVKVEILAGKIFSVCKNKHNLISDKFHIK